jgi:radical SAM protein with 4Fe4S-binding SPASM domain
MMRKLKIIGVTYTDQCNQYCKHCHNRSKFSPLPDELSLSQWKTIIYDLKEMGLEFISFGGGESFLRKDFIDFVEFLNKVDVRVGVITNGYDLKKNEIPWDLFETVTVSLDYVNPKQYDEWRGISGAFEQAIDTINFLVSRRIETEVISTITNDTASIYNLNFMKNLIINLGVDYWKLNRYRKIGRAENVEGLELESKQFFKVIEWCDKNFNKIIITDALLAALYPKVLPYHHTSCAESTLRIGSNGNITPCTFLGKLVIGNALHDDLNSLWNNNATLENIRNRKPSGKCEKCNVWNICTGGCFASAYLNFGQFGAPDPQCWKNENENVSNVNSYLDNDYKASMRSYSCNIYVDLKEAVNE